MSSTSSDEDFAKVTYMTRGGAWSSAYIDIKSGQGTDKHTDEELQVEYDEVADCWIRVDRKLWNFNPYTGEWTFDRAMTDDEYNEAFVRMRANGK